MDDLRKVKRAIGITGGKALSSRNAFGGCAARMPAGRGPGGAPRGQKKGAAVNRGALPLVPEAPPPNGGNLRSVLQCYFFGASAGAGAAGAAAALSAGAAAGGGGGAGASSFFAQAARTMVPASSSPKNSDTYLRIGS